MNKFVIMIALLSGLNVQAQYLNRILEPTKDNTKAKYYQKFSGQGTGYIRKIFYMNDSLYSITHLSSVKPPVRNGEYIEYNEKGGIKVKSNYINGKLEGKYLSYYDNGKLEYDIDYVDDEISGYLKSYYDNGNIRRIDHYKGGKFVDGKCYGISGRDTTYFIYQQMARFKKGDLDKFQKYVMSKVRYPDEALERDITGKVLIFFNVNAEGKVVDTEVLESPNFYLSVAAVETILDSPDWEPAIVEGKKVKTSFVIPITFQIQ